MKLVEASLRDRKGLESNFLHCGCAVKLVQACLSRLYNVVTTTVDNP